MQQPLSSPLSAIKPAYDVVVIGSGYGGGVAASRLSRAGQLVCVIEKGKEFPTGSFPSRLPELRRELQLNGGKMRSGSRTGLFDFRLGADIHVLVGCGLGGGSLINAGVALKPDARVFADPAWPDELSADGLLELGFKRAAAMLRPSRYANAPELTKYRALAIGERRVRRAAGRGARGGELRGHRQPRGSGTTRLHAVRRLLLGLQCRRQEHRRHDLSARRQGAWRGDLHRTQRQLMSPKGRGAGASISRRRTQRTRAPSFVDAKTVVLAAGTLGSTEILLRSRERGLGLSDRLGEGFSANGDIIAFALGGRERVNGIGVGFPSKFDGDVVGACRRRADRASRRSRSRPLHDLAGRRAAFGARPAAARVLHRRRQAARRGAKPDQGRLSGPAIASAYLLRRVA